MADEVETKIEYLGQPGVIGEVTYDALKKRIAELEAAIYQYVNHVVSYEGTSFIDEINEPSWAKLINDTWVKQAAKGEEK